MTETLPIPVSSPLTKAQKAALVNLVRRAARAEVMPRFRNLAAADITSKSGPDDLVTEADHAAEAMIARGLQKMFPHALVVGEEAAAADPALRGKLAEAELAFILDPVDGTWNFVNGLAVFGVIVSVTRFGKPVFGLLYDPVMDDFITAEEDGAAQMTRATGRARPVSTSQGGEIDSLSGYIHFSLMDRAVQEELAPLLPKFGRTGSLRCSCHEYRMLAQGHADFLLSSTLNPWDHAAGVLIVQRAGGVVRMLDGRDYNAGIETGYLLAAANEASWQNLHEVFSILVEDDSA
ncbi:inositol monophosphatase family protein [Roseovarius confluentis]|uniref:inositol monophosphatase family protein n=1 Tax=Roseovarius confluentis TaxID=1852027 RepID=UPI000CDDB9C0|nr:inositol monophosphatase [Roseovarius confluentis]